MPTEQTKTAANDPSSSICPNCGKNNVDDVPGNSQDYFTSQPQCPDCGWEGKIEIV
jgi:predicted RNA-binding Zn-ribbon protein involved in translation (DUF1610 family)